MKLASIFFAALLLGGCATPSSSWVMLAPNEAASSKELVEFLSKISAEWNRVLGKSRVVPKEGTSVTLIVTMGEDGKLKVARIEGVTDGAQKESVMAAVEAVQKVSSKWTISRERFAEIEKSGEWRLAFNYVE